MNRYGLWVQQRVRKRRKAMRAKLTVRKTVGRIIVRLRFSADWLLDATMAMLVGVLVAAVGEVMGHSEENVGTFVEDDEVVELGYCVEDVVTAESAICAVLDSRDDSRGNVVATVVDPCNAADDDRMDDVLEVDINVG